MQFLQTNEDLAMLAAAGDEAALWQLFNQTKRMMFKIINRYKAAARINGAFDLEDLEQIGMMAFFDAVNRFEPDRGGFLNLMIIRVNHELQNQLYIGRPRIESSGLYSLDAPASLNPEQDISLLDTIIDPDAPDPCECAVLEGMRADVRNAVARLPSGQREVIEAKYFSGKTTRQICEDYSLNDSAVRGHERHAIRKLRIYCKEYDEDLWKHTGLRSFLNTWTSATEQAALELIERRERQDKLFNVVVKSFYDE